MEVLRAAAVVVGAGVHGSSAALHLARAGQDTILLEQFPLPHSRGSSHGPTRMIRSANRSLPALTPIMADSFPMWKKLEKEAGVSLLRPSPMLVVCDDPVTTTKITTSIRQAGQEPIMHEVSEVNRKYGMNMPDDCQALTDPSAGILMADKCVQTLQRLFCESGGRLVDEWPVEEVEVRAFGEVEIRGPKGRVRTARLVLCPGAWAGPLLAKIGIHIPLQVKRISVFYWLIKDKATHITTFSDHRDFEGGHTYGNPCLEYPGMVKVMQLAGSDIENPDERDKSGSPVDHRNLMMRYVKEYLPYLHHEPAVEETCIYTCTPDNEFVVDRHPCHPNIVFACGFSGTGFKIAPAIGEDLCRLALGRPTVRDLSAFNASRFKPNKM